MNIIGNGGLAKQIKDVVDSIHTYSISQKGKVTALLNAGYLQDDDERVHNPYIIGFATLDNISEREVAYHILANEEHRTIGTLISPYATVSQDAQIAEGGVVLHRAFIGPGASLDTNVLVGTGAIIEHDSLIGEHSVILTGAIVNGGCNIGCRCMIGSGAVIIHGINICDDVTIGAGAIVIEDITVPGTYVGNPCRIVGVPLP